MHNSNLTDGKFFFPNKSNHGLHVWITALNSRRNMFQNFRSFIIEESKNLYWCVTSLTVDPLPSRRHIFQSRAFVRRLPWWCRWGSKRIGRCPTSSPCSRGNWWWKRRPEIIASEISGDVYNSVSQTFSSRGSYIFQIFFLLTITLLVGLIWVSFIQQIYIT